MQDESLESQLRRLLTGLADQAILGRQSIRYEGADLHADEVSHLLFESVLCLAQERSGQMGTGSFGLAFELTKEASGGFPLALRKADALAGLAFFEVAPILLQVFDDEVMRCRTDISQVFEAASRLVQPGFRLDRSGAAA